MFQSLDRDSGCSDFQPECDFPEHSPVSIPRSGFWLFGPASSDDVSPVIVVSIPRSGFWLFGPAPLMTPNLELLCFNPSIGILVVRTQDQIKDILVEMSFNPSIGILVVRTPSSRRRRLRWRRFQSLDRDSGCSDLAVRARRALHRLSFQSLDRDSGCSDKLLLDANALHRVVSIPRSGFWLFGRAGVRRRHPDDARFNPSIGILVVRTNPTVLRKHFWIGFNPSIGILVVRTAIRYASIFCSL